jgi:hypothetical protein
LLTALLVCERAAKVGSTNVRPSRGATTSLIDRVVNPAGPNQRRSARRAPVQAPAGRRVPTSTAVRPSAEADLTPSSQAAAVAHASGMKRQPFWRRKSQKSNACSFAIRAWLVVPPAPPDIAGIDALPVPSCIIAPSGCVIPALPVLPPLHTIPAFTAPALDIVPARIPLRCSPPEIP